MDLLLRYYNLKGITLFIIVLSGNLLIVGLSKGVLINETVFYNTYSEQLTYERSLSLFETMKDLSWIGYVFAPVMLLLKFSLISLVIYIGIVFFNLNTVASLGSVFKVVIASELIFVLAGLAKFFWFYLFAGNYDLNDIGFFYPLSLINLFNIEEVSKPWVFPLQTLNLFHLLYLVCIAFGLNKVCSIEKSKSERVVLASYLPALFFWITLIVFLSVDAGL